MSDIRKQIASSIFRTAIAFERAEMDGRPTNGLATQINNLRGMLVEAGAPVEWFYEQRSAPLSAIPRQPQPQVEIDGDVLFA